MVNMKEPYGSYCAGMMYDLNNRFPNNFWSSPTEFFLGVFILSKLTPQMALWSMLVLITA